MTIADEWDGQAARSRRHDFDHRVDFSQCALALKYPYTNNRGAIVIRPDHTTAEPASASKPAD
jgi:hypothetical protein